MSCESEQRLAARPHLGGGVPAEQIPRALLRNAQLVAWASPHVNEVENRILVRSS
ncbi:MAG: hypothetical protein ACTHMQ_07015 [Protaetiibacter sp.]